MIIYQLAGSLRLSMHDRIGLWDTLRPPRSNASQWSRCDCPESVRTPKSNHVLGTGHSEAIWFRKRWGSAECRTCWVWGWRSTTFTVFCYERKLMVLIVSITIETIKKLPRNLIVSIRPHETYWASEGLLEWGCTEPVSYFESQTMNRNRV